MTLLVLLLFGGTCPPDRCTGLVLSTPRQAFKSRTPSGPALAAP
jgi:hypothetical protein